MSTKTFYRVREDGMYTTVESFEAEEATIEAMKDNAADVRQRMKNISSTAFEDCEYMMNGTEAFTSFIKAKKSAIEHMQSTRDAYNDSISYLREMKVADIDQQ